MTTIGWIDALRRYNLGGSSWCIPRRGTPEYDKVMMIRKGAEDVKPQPRRRTVKVRLPEEKPEPEPEAEVVVPTVKMDEPEPSKTNQESLKKMSVSKSKGMDRIAEIEKQIETELDAGVVSVLYDLGWKPETTDKVISGGERHTQARDYQYLMRLDSMPTTLDTGAVNKIIGDPNEPEWRREFAKMLLKNIVAWKPKNDYYSRSAYYNTKTKTGATDETKPALEDYQQFADKVNAVRGTPIRTITYNTQFEMNGTRTLMAYWSIVRHLFDEVSQRGYDKEYQHFVREYQLTPEFKFIGGTTIKDIEKEVEDERKKEEMEKQKAEEKAKDPLAILREEYKAVNDLFYKTKYDDPKKESIRQQRQDLDNKVKAIEKERKKTRESTEEGQKVKALQSEDKTLMRQQDKLTSWNSDEYKSIERRREEIEKEIKALRQEMRKK